MAGGAVSILVLVVDDEDIIHLLIGDALEEGGYSVDAATGPEQALGLLDQKHAEYRAVITDVNMGAGKPTGWDVARRARELSPDIPVIYMTGDSGEDWTANGVPNSVLILKPFAPAQIVTAVSNLLNAGSPVSPP
jgi:CheY-like chemotaxis protein